MCHIREKSSLDLGAFRVSFAKWSNSQSLVSDRRQMGIELAVTDSIWTKASSTTDSTGEAHPVVNIDPVRIGFYDLPISPRISKLGRKYLCCGFGRKVLGAKPWIMRSRWSARFHPPKKWRHGGGLCRKCQKRRVINVATMKSQWKVPPKAGYRTWLLTVDTPSELWSSEVIWDE